MSKPQLYPDLSTVRLLRYESSKEVVEILVLFKRGAQYYLCDVKGKNTFHLTENQLTKKIEEAAIHDSPLIKALE